jgi:Flp pilus assembly protein TadD
MTEEIESKSPEETAAEGVEAAAPEEPALTDRIVQSFEEALRSEGPTVFDRLGYAMFHSLDDRTAQSARAQRGFKPIDALDHYNLGCHQAEAGEFGKAAKSFERAAELNPELAEAVYNLALAQEKAGDLPQARKSWKRWLDLVAEGDETVAVKHHLTELANR